MEYDFAVKPGADVTKLGIRFTGADNVTLDARGDIVVRAQGAEMRQRRPRVLQGGAEVPSWYEIEDGMVRVRMAAFDPGAELTIDPVLDFSTYLGGPGSDSLWAITTAPDGNPVVAGGTQSPASPTLDPFQQPSVVSLAPIVMKMSADGRRVIFYTILGKNGWDEAHVIVFGKIRAIPVPYSTHSNPLPPDHSSYT